MCWDVQGFFLSRNQLCEHLLTGSVDYQGHRLQACVGNVGYAVLCTFMVQFFLLLRPLFVLHKLCRIHSFSADHLFGNMRKQSLRLA